MVQHPGGNVTLTNGFAYTPTVTGVTPSTGPQSGAVVTVTGTGFTDATGVTFGGVPGTAFSVQSPTTISVTAPAGVGQVDVVVQHPGGNVTLTNGFAYTPTVTGIDPVTGPAAGATTVTITGTGFTDATGVTFGGSAGTDFVVVSETSITVTTPAGTAGAVDVVVLHPGGNVTLTNGFTYTP